MGKKIRYSQEVRERSVRMVLDQRSSHPSQWAAVVSIAKKDGYSPQTLQSWVKQAERDSEKREGLTTAERERVKELERESGAGGHNQETSTRIPDIPENGNLVLATMLGAVAF